MAKASAVGGERRSDTAHTSNQEEDLHYLITADTEEKVNKANELIHNITETFLSKSTAEVGQQQHSNGDVVPTRV